MKWSVWPCVFRSFMLTVPCWKPFFMIELDLSARPVLSAPIHTPLNNISVHQGHPFTKAWAVAKFLQLLSCSFLKPFSTDVLGTGREESPAEYVTLWDIKWLATGNKRPEGPWILNATLRTFLGMAAQGVFFFFLFCSCRYSNKKLVYKMSLDPLVLKDGECLHLEIPQPCLFS